MYKSNPEFFAPIATAFEPDRISGESFNFLSL